MPPTPPGALWAAIDARIIAEPTRPLLTCYLDPPETGPDAGESDRIDLTGTTWTTWVAKTVNMLREIGGLVAGEPADVLLRLPAHWQTAVWTEACLRLGAHVELDRAGGEPTDTDPGGDRPFAVIATDRPRLARALAEDADEVFVLPLLPMNGVAPEPLPGGVWDYAAEVSAFGDRADLGRAAMLAAADGARLSDAGVELDGRGLLAAADARADAAGLEAGGRLLATGSGPGGPWVDLLAAARRGGSLVLAPDLARLDPDRAARRWAAERVTAGG
jgi:uncharacterized protein (TIGR03089 family)